MPHRGFALRPDGRPKILNYEDAFAYIVRSRNFLLPEALALHFFHLDLRIAIDRLEEDEGKPMSRADIDDYVYRHFWVELLDDYGKEAAEILESSKNDILRKYMRRNRFSQWIPLSGVWASFWGNLATIAIGFVFLVAADWFLTPDRHAAFEEYIKRCLVPPAAQTTSGSETSKHDLHSSIQ